MKVKMTIFVQLYKQGHGSIFQKWSKNEVENEQKMSEKWLL